MRILLLLWCTVTSFALQAQKAKAFTYAHGATVRGDSTKKELALLFTADESGEGLPAILQTLKKEKVKAGFFFTGRFYRTPLFQPHIQQVKREGHYLGPHSDRHLLYCDWVKRDSLLVTKDSFEADIRQNVEAMKEAGIVRPNGLFIPPFEWWNDSVTAWSKAIGLRLFNFTPGIRTAVDYTWPEMEAAYKSSRWIMDWLKEFIKTKPAGLNGAIVLLHAGTDPRRADKFYTRLSEAIRLVKKAGYSFVRIDDLLR